jgi:hypothetical protein
MQLAQQIQVNDHATLCGHLDRRANKAPAFRLLTRNPYFKNWSMMYTVNKIIMSAVQLMHPDHMGYTSHGTLGNVI